VEAVSDNNTVFTAGLLYRAKVAGEKYLTAEVLEGVPKVSAQRT
jgi:hypothetical protein